MARHNSSKGVQAPAFPDPVTETPAFSQADNDLADESLSDLAMSFWAKSGRSDTTRWLSVAQHLMDASDVAGHLFDEYLCDHQRELMASVWEGDQSKARATLRFLAGVHDVGKISLHFACQCPRLAELITAHDIDVPLPKSVPNRSDLPHGFVSQFALVDAITRGGGDKERAYEWAAIIGVHHGRYPETEKVRRAWGTYRVGEGNSRQEPAWDRVRQELLEWAALRTGFPLSPGKPSALPSVPISVAAAYAALVVTADWIASNEEYFPLLPLSEREERMGAEGQAERVRQGWARAGIPSPMTLHQPVRSNTAAQYRHRFGWGEEIVPTTTQIRAVELADQEDPDLIVVEAPPGSGKTELAFLVAETLIRKRRLQGMIIALPTQATTDAMFTRTQRWLSSVLREEKQRVGVHLAHGKNDLNEEFLSLLRAGNLPLEVHDEDSNEGMYASSWMTARWRSTLSPIVIGTIDQVLLAALKSRHVLMRHLGLMGKVVIIDEVHAADTYMATYLESALTWLGMYRVPVILMSATLPAELRSRLVSAYRRGRSQGCEEQSGLNSVTVGYPAITTLSSSGRKVASYSPESSEIHFPKHIRVLVSQGEKTFVETLESCLCEGGCALVVRNTVRAAQETYKALIRHFGEENVTLLHSRFLSCDRVERDACMLRLFGKERSRRPRKHVVVATQVIEQSLDVDFDLLFTDPAPMDLILQRIGRLHRHGERERPKGLEKAECFVLVNDIEDAPWSFDKGSATVYGDHKVLRTLAMLAERSDGLIVSEPKDYADLTQRAYSTDLIGPDSWQELLEEARKEEEKRNNSARLRARTWTLNGSGLPEWTAERLVSSFAGNQATGDERGGGAHAAARAAVRDSEDQIPVLVIPVDPEMGGVAVLPPWWENEGEETMIDTSVWPSPALVRRMRSWSISLPPWQFRQRGQTIEDTIDAVVGALWNDPSSRSWGCLEHPALRGELILPMVKVDEQSGRLEANLLGRRLIYTNTRGMEVLN